MPHPFFVVALFFIEEWCLVVVRLVLVLKAIIGIIV